MGGRQVIRFYSSHFTWLNPIHQRRFVFLRLWAEVRFVNLAHLNSAHSLPLRRLSVRRLSVIITTPRANIHSRVALSLSLQQYAFHRKPGVALKRNSR
jgi:hypothetical protein